MKTLILDGSHAGDPQVARIFPALQEQLQRRGWSAETVTLRARPYQKANT
jgi:hypothetical protein